MMPPDYLFRYFHFSSPIRRRCRSRFDFFFSLCYAFAIAFFAAELFDYVFYACFCLRCFSRHDCFDFTAALFFFLLRLIDFA